MASRKETGPASPDTVVTGQTFPIKQKDSMSKSPVSAGDSSEAARRTIMGMTYNNADGMSSDVMSGMMKNRYRS